MSSLAAVLPGRGLLISPSQVVLSIAVSLLASLAVYLMYHLFYGSKHIGAGVDRTFLIGGPAITALFLGIQSSIPLSLGLLGALSFVRFRTPVKDPAEIGFLLLLIASSIGAATGTYAIMVVLIAAAFVCLSVQWLLHRRFSLRRFSDLIVSMDMSIFPELEGRLMGLLCAHLDHVQVKTISTMDGRISAHYQFKARPGFDQAKLVRSVANLASPASVEVFVGPS